MSTSRRNRQQRFVRAVVYILVLALIIGLIVTMAGTALASPAPQTPTAAESGSATASPAPANQALPLAAPRLKRPSSFPHPESARAMSHPACRQASISLLKT